MKKLALTAALCLSLCCLSACDEKPDVVPDRYGALNDMLGAAYSQIAITVTETFGEGLSLKGEYVITYAEGIPSLSYRVEQFAEFGDAEELPEDLKITLSGEAVMKDGKLQTVEGDALQVSPYFADGLTFKEEYFGNAELTDVYLRADVKDPVSFLGDPTLRCNGMYVEAVFLDLFVEIGISYTAEDGSAVEYTYEFSR